MLTMLPITPDEVGWQLRTCLSMPAGAPLSTPPAKLSPLLPAREPPCMPPGPCPADPALAMPGKVGPPRPPKRSSLNNPANRQLLP